MKVAARRSCYFDTLTTKAAEIAGLLLHFPTFTEKSSLDANRASHRKK